MTRKNDRVQENGRSYRDGFAPSQLPEFIIADCARCKGVRTLVIARGGGYCMSCSPVERFAR